MLLLPIPRKHLLNFLPKGGRVAEIGVAQGDFSREILSRVEPAELHLIDPWIHQDREDYQLDKNNAPDAEQQNRYENILTKFKPEIDCGQVKMHRSFSQDVFPEFEDGFFDIIYIDGLHSYEGVKADLQNYYSKVKPEGFILGHDYTNNPAVVSIGYGVVQAVNEFVINNKWHFAALTTECFPTYVLAMNSDSEAAKLLAMKLSYNIPSLIELRDYPEKHSFQHKALPFNTNKVSLVYSF